MKPLRSEANLRLDSGIQGFPPRKRKKNKNSKTKRVVVRETRSDGQTVSDDPEEEMASTMPSMGADTVQVMASSSDEEYDYSTSHSKIRRQQDAAIAAKKPAKLPRIQPAMRDLWSDDVCKSLEILSV